MYVICIHTKWNVHNQWNLYVMIIYLWFYVLLGNTTATLSYRFSVKILIYHDKKIHSSTLTSDEQVFGDDLWTK